MGGLFGGGGGPDYSGTMTALIQQNSAMMAQMQAMNQQLTKDQKEAMELKFKYEKELVKLSQEHEDQLK